MFHENEITAVLVDALLQKLPPGEEIRVEKASVSSGDPGDYVIRVDAAKDGLYYVLTVQPIKEAQARDRGVPEGALVRYRHWRRTTNRGGLYMRHQVPGVFIKPNGGLTECFITYNGLFAVGVAHVNPNDVYCKATGRDLALMRALVNLYRQIDTQAEKVVLQNAIAKSRGGAVAAVDAADAERNAS